MHILLVEDNPGDARLVQEALKARMALSYELTRVDHLAAALEELTTDHIDVVLLDLSLPDEKGLETLRRAYQSAPHVPIVVLTGLNDEKRAVEAIQHGAQDYLSKAHIDGPLLERSLRYAIERSQTLQALKASEERYARAVRGANDGLWDWNLRTQTIYYSSRWKSMLGYVEEEIGDSPEEWFSRIHKDDLSRVQSKIKSHLDGLTSQFEDEHRMRHRDGGYRWILSRGLAFRDESNSTRQMAGSHTDITARKEIDRLKDEFVSTVSHELRTPLTSIHGALRLVASGSSGMLSPQGRALIEIACKNSDRLTLLINDLLDLQKIESGAFDMWIAAELKLQPLMPLVDQAVRINGPYAQQLGTRIQLGQQAVHAGVKVDSNRLIQVLTNLLSNACKFSPPNDAVTVSVEDHGEKVRVSVTDHGSGIPEEFRPRIFEKFAQADGSASRLKGGTGLGLSIAKGIIQSFGGQMAFDSQPGLRTTFYFELPKWNLPTNPEVL